MKLTHILYHEDNFHYPYLPQEDYFASFDNIFVVADGVTHEPDENGIYPENSDAAKVAEIICETFISQLKDTPRELDDIKAAIPIISEKVRVFVESTENYKNRETNGYTIGASVFALVVIHQGRLIYALLDDCFFSIFSDDLVDHPMLKSYVAMSAKHFDVNFNWKTADGRKVWRKEYRNHSFEKDGQKLGYGVIDGRSGFEQFIQYGEEVLKDGDLICLNTDGFIKPLQDKEFIENVKNKPFSDQTFKYISAYTKEKDIYKEKTCYFVKYS